MKVKIISYAVSTWSFIMRFFERHPTLKEYLYLLISIAQKAMMIAYEITGLQFLLNISMVLENLLILTNLENQYNDEYVTLP